MSRRILVEQYHVAATVSGKLPAEDREVIRKMLSEKVWWRAVQQALRTAQVQFPELQAVKFTLSV
jgi:hypothetical protein